MSLFLLLLLLINPTIEKMEIENEKPTLSVLVDNSKSVSFFKEGKNVTDIVSSLQNNRDLTTKFF
ncbi:hypothetical protein [Polaribacter filamentus]|uniref:hypothetical protein n=1 Tax=Polaribacter filamentus TaxID=53483 RepID=UPI001F0B8865|nr:hypothetical protein [Polaribacter filamentus]